MRFCFGVLLAVILLGSHEQILASDCRKGLFPQLDNPISTNILRRNIVFNPTNAFTLLNWSRLRTEHLSKGDLVWDHIRAKHWASLAMIDGPGIFLQDLEINQFERLKNRVLVPLRSFAPALIVPREFIGQRKVSRDNREYDLAIATQLALLLSSAKEKIEPGDLAWDSGRFVEVVQIDNLGGVVAYRDVVSSRPGIAHLTEFYDTASAIIPNQLLPGSKTP